VKVALVTGGARRIGAVLARALAEAGYAVALHYRHSAEDAQAHAAALRADGHSVELFQADFSTPADCQALIAAVRERFGRLDLLINNASLFEYDTFEALSAARWDRHITTNLTAPVFLIHAFATALGEDETGVVVNLLDQKVLRPNPDYFSYTAGKLGLAALTPVLAQALAPKVRVCGLSPGVTLPSGKQSEDDYVRAARATPSGISSTPADVARALLFIVDNPAFSGQTLTIDGGESLLGRTRDVAYDPDV
jgi:NAD(P)-dependent dehydrogenase (short-subunit alcohol dehydrogenase family)